MINYDLDGVVGDSCSRNILQIFAQNGVVVGTRNFTNLQEILSDLFLDTVLTWLALHGFIF